MYHKNQHHHKSKDLPSLFADYITPNGTGVSDVCLEAGALYIKQLNQVFLSFFSSTQQTVFISTSTFSNLSFSGQWASAKNVWRLSQGLILFKWYLCWYHQEYNKGSSIRATGQHDHTPSRHLWLLPWGLRIPDFAINCPFVCLKLFLPCCLKSGCLTSTHLRLPHQRWKENIACSLLLWRALEWCKVSVHSMFICFVKVTLVFNEKYLPRCQGGGWWCEHGQAQHAPHQQQVSHQLGLAGEERGDK